MLGNSFGVELAEDVRRDLCIPMPICRREYRHDQALSKLLKLFEVDHLLLFKLSIYATILLISSFFNMRFGIVRCGVRRNPYNAIPLIPGVLATASNVGAWKLGD